MDAAYTRLMPATGQLAAGVLSAVSPFTLRQFAACTAQSSLANVLTLQTRRCNSPVRLDGSGSNSITTEAEAAANSQNEHSSNPTAVQESASEASSSLSERLLSLSTRFSADKSSAEPGPAPESTGLSKDAPSSLSERLLSLVGPTSRAEGSLDPAGPANMAHYRSQEDVDTSDLRSAVFEDIGVPQQTAWYEVATGDPLTHPNSPACIYLHSVNRFHAASLETVRSMMMLLRPSVLAVHLPNDMSVGIVGAAKRRLELACNSEHVQRIADGYQRICLGLEDPSDLNPNLKRLRKSYREGKELAKLHHMEDYETVLQSLADDPEAQKHLKEAAPDKFLYRDVWHAMYLSGMSPWEHLDRPIVEAAEAGRVIELVDVPQAQLDELTEQVLTSTSNPRAEADLSEGQAYFDLLYEYGERTMPLNLPDEVWHIMATATMSPQAMHKFYSDLAQKAPCTFEIMKYRAAYTVRALQTLAMQCEPGEGSEPNIVCLVERQMEPLIRLQWQELATSLDKPGDNPYSIVNDLPFTSKPLQRVHLAKGRRSKQ